jgi:mono/diheme cytochrome c family protein
MPSQHHHNAWKFWLSRSGGAALLAAFLYAITYPSLYAGGDGKTEQKSAATSANTTTAQKLTGEDLYAINCNRCHAERYPREWTPSQWKTLMMHMRVRANLPADQAREILKYMQEQSGN